MIHPALACLGLCCVALLALISCRDMLRAVPPPTDEVTPEMPWLLIVIQAGALALIFLGFCVLSFGYSAR